MATNVKCIWDFTTQYGRGFSEIHYLSYASSNAPSLRDILIAMQNLIPTFMAFRGEDITCTNIRASYPVVGAIASLGQLVQPPAPGSAGSAGASWATSLAMQWKDSTFTRHKIVHIRGFWNSVIKDEEYDPQGAVGKFFQVNLGRYAAALTAGAFGWLTVQPTSFFGTVTGYVVNAGGTVTLTIAPAVNSGAAPAGTGPFAARFSRINRSNSILNRVIPCTYNAGASTLTTVYPVGAGPFQAGGRFKIPVTQFVPYFSVNQIRTGERRMGKAGNLYPGRAKRRPVN